ncbi:hypothetical protein BSL78_03798 [Apostichopus japonicus]|uniref:Peptidase S59 domain-containing protein n=1 Tax=Stichopus japonicus TaxID=307972 RepID=A0A2G8LGB1_STIJA|nr:hypothetical protein BSL78_03798 [Apostichopus japonicus]
MFGQQNTQFGSSGFGANQTSAFSTPASGGFGTPSAFGAQTPSTNLFGNTANSNTSGGLFGNNNNNRFGQPNTSSGTGFSFGSNVFGTSNNNTATSTGEEVSWHPSKQLLWHWSIWSQAGCRVWYKYLWSLFGQQQAVVALCLDSQQTRPLQESWSQCRRKSLWFISIRHHHQISRTPTGGYVANRKGGTGTGILGMGMTQQDSKSSGLFGQANTTSGFTFGTQSKPSLGVPPLQEGLEPVAVCLARRPSPTAKWWIIRAAKPAFGQTTQSSSLFGNTGTGTSLFGKIRNRRPSSASHYHSDHHAIVWRWNHTFGATTNTFGNSSFGQNTFGQPNQTGSLFNKPTGFGTSTGNTGLSFGTQSNSLFGNQSKPGGLTLGRHKYWLWLMMMIEFVFLEWYYLDGGHSILLCLYLCLISLGSYASVLMVEPLMEQQQMEDCLGTKARQGLAQDWGQVVRLDLPWGQLSTLALISEWLWKHWIKHGWNQAQLGGNAPSQNAQSQLHLFNLLNSPYGDNPLFKNKLTEKDAKDGSNKSTSFLVSARQSPSAKPKPHFSNNKSWKAKFFEGLEEEDPTLSPATFVPRRSVKKLVIKKKLELEENHVNDSSLFGKTLSTDDDLIERTSIYPERDSDRDHAMDRQNSSKEDGDPNCTVSDLNPTGGSKPTKKSLESSAKVRLGFKNPPPIWTSLLSWRYRTSWKIYHPSPGWGCLTQSGVLLHTLLEGVGFHHQRRALREVENFTIGREGYGSVFFPGVTDISNLNLDEIVYFRRKEITVYPDDDSKPAEGEGLNKRAEVTLDRTWPVDKSSREPITDTERLNALGYEEKLERANHQVGS